MYWWPWKWDFGLGEVVMGDSKGIKEKRYRHLKILLDHMNRYEVFGRR
jgi:hypothetical protein